MKKFFSIFKWFVLAAALLMIFGPFVLKWITARRDEQQIQTSIRLEKSVDLDKLQALNDLLNTNPQLWQDPFDANNTAKTPGPTQTLPVADDRLLTLLDSLRSTDTVNAAVIIPRIGVKVPVYYGTGLDVLARGAGILEGTALPSGKLGQHSVIASHRGTYYAKTFHDLGLMEEGDQFSLLMYNVLLIYRVNRVKIVPPWGFDVNDFDTTKSELTLYTCDPIPSFENRLLVKGELIHVYEVKMGEDLNALTLKP